MAVNDGKPKNIIEYKNWLEKEHGFEVSERTRTYYESVTSKVRQDFEKSGLWIQLTDNLEEYDSEYLLKTGYHLFMPFHAPKVYIKPFDAFLLKTFRKNILENENYPNKPNGG